MPSDMRGGSSGVHAGGNPRFLPPCAAAGKCQYRAAKWTSSGPAPSRAPGRDPTPTYRNPVPVRRAYKFLLRPTAKQAAALGACLEDHRQLYNAALEERREAWKTRAASVGYYHQATQLPAIREADPGGQGRWSAGRAGPSGRGSSLRSRSLQGAEESRQHHRRPEVPLSRLLGAFDQMVEPLITDLTCLRSQGLKLFHLVNAYAVRCRGELRPNGAGPRRSRCRPDAGPGTPSRGAANRLPRTTHWSAYRWH